MAKKSKKSAEIKKWHENILAAVPKAVEVKISDVPRNNDVASLDYKDMLNSAKTGWSNPVSNLEI